jgi:Protein of unknown function (DUF1242)
MSAIFDFSSILMIFLLMVCTTTYLRELRPTIFDGTQVRRSLDCSRTFFIFVHLCSTWSASCCCWQLAPRLFDDQLHEGSHSRAQLKPVHVVNVGPFAENPCLVLSPHVFFIFTNGGFLDAQSRDASQHVHYHRDGMMGFCWKLSRIGERLSPFVGASCLIMAVYVLFK